jgi:hypothetical protein
MKDERCETCSRNERSEKLLQTSVYKPKLGDHLADYIVHEKYYKNYILINGF